MALFRRAAREPDAAPTRGSGTEEFWAWWAADGAARCAAAIAARDVQPVVAALSDRVAAVHPSLAWELAPGAAAQHRLVVTAEGDPDLRAVARRWRRQAPPATSTWEYADTRAAGSLATSLEIGGESITFDDVDVAITRTAHRLDVVVWHARFPALTEELRHQVMFLALDEALGEADVEAWLGHLEAAAERPARVVPLRELVAAVATLREECVGDDGGPIWVLLRAETPEGLLLASARVPLSPMVAPELDDHVAVGVPFREQTDAGLPAPSSLAALRALEDHLVERLGGGGLLVGHETCAGVRVLHFYVDSTGPGAAVLEAAAVGWDDGQVNVRPTYDPAWQAVRHLRG